MQFIGNVKRIGSEQSDTHKLMFNPNRENFIPLNAEVVDKTQSPVGSIKIESIVETAQEPIRIVESNGLCSTKEIIVPRDPLIENKHITELPVYLKSQEPEPDGKINALIEILSIPLSRLYKNTFRLSLFLRDDV